VEALRALEGYPWPGNVRELENVVQRILVTREGNAIDGEDVRRALAPAAPTDPLEALAMEGITLEQLEARYVEAVLRRTDGSKAKAAAILGIDMSTLYRRGQRRPRDS
jgi:two-component system, NtrC family, response regulator HydG